MKKKSLSITIIIIIIASMICINLNSTNVYATTTVNQTTDMINSESLDSIKLYFQEKITKLNSQKKQVTNVEEIKSINEEINGYTNILDNIKNKNITDGDVNKAKILLNNDPGTVAVSNDYPVLAYSSIDYSRRIYQTTYAAVVLAIKIGGQMGYELSAKLLSQSMNASEGSTYNIWNNDPLVTSRVKASSYYKSRITELKNKYKSSGQANNFKYSFSISFNGGQSIVEKDMYYSIHGTSPSSISVNNGYSDMVLNDVYDFPELSMPNGVGDLFSTSMNNLGRSAVLLGICKVYNVKIHTVEPFYDSIPKTTTTTTSNASSYQSYYALNFQKWYNNTTQTSSPMAEDGIYGPETAKYYAVLGTLLNGTYNSNPSSYQSYYVLNFQKWYNKTTQTSSPMAEDGIYGPETARYYAVLGRLLNGTY